MKRAIICAAAAFCLINTPALAQSKNIWDGYYVGMSTMSASMDKNFTAYTPYNNYAGFTVSGLKDNETATGLQGGYLKQFGKIGLGAELAVNFTNLDKTSSNNPPNRIFGQSVDKIISFAPRIAYLTDKTQTYFEYGYTKSDIKAMHNRGYEYEAEATSKGSIIGIGFEYKLDDKLGIGIAYDKVKINKKNIYFESDTYYDISEYDSTSSGPSGPWAKMSPDVDLLKLSLNYHF